MLAQLYPKDAVYVHVNLHACTDIPQSQMRDSSLFLIHLFVIVRYVIAISDSTYTLQL